MKPKRLVGFYLFSNTLMFLLILDHHIKIAAIKINLKRHYYKPNCNQDTNDMHFCGFKYKVNVSYQMFLCKTSMIIMTDAN